MRRGKTLSEPMHRALQALIAAVRVVKPEQGERARRTARQRVLRQLRAVRAVLDAECPAQPVPRKPRALKLVMVKNPRKRAERRGLVEVPAGAVERLLLQAGVRITPIEIAQGVWRKYAPGWAARAPASTPVTMVRAARRSMKARDALEAFARAHNSGATS